MRRYGAAVLGLAVLAGFLAGCGRPYSASKASAAEAAKAESAVQRWVKEVASSAASANGAVPVPADLLEPGATVMIAQVTRAGSGLLKAEVLVTCGGRAKRHLFILTRKDGRYEVTGIM